MGWITEESCFNSWEKCEIFLFSKDPRLDLGPTYPPVLKVPRRFIMSVKESRGGCKTYHSPPPIVNVKNSWSRTSTFNTTS